MGARFSRYQPLQPVTIKNGVVKIYRVYGDFITFNANTSFECEMDMTNFVSSRVIMKATQGNRIFVLRTDWTWSEYLIEDEEKILLVTLGFANVANQMLPSYIPIAQIRTESSGNLLMLDVTHPNIAHGGIGGCRTKTDVYFEKDLPTNADGYDLNQSGLNLLYEKSDGKIFSIVYNGEELEVPNRWILGEE